MHSDVQVKAQGFADLVRFQESALSIIVLRHIPWSASADSEGRMDIRFLRQYLGHPSGILPKYEFRVTWVNEKSKYADQW